MGAFAGIEMRAYRNTAGTGAGPTWVELKNLRELKLDFTKGEADATTRGGRGWKAYKGTTKDFSVEGQVIYDPSDPDYVALQSAFLTDQVLDLAFADGDIEQGGTTYIRTGCEVFGFTRNEGNEEVVMSDITFKRSFGTEPPVFVTVGA